MLWKNKILVRADPPFSSFYYLHLILLQNPSLFVELHSLCWKLSRRWRLACFSDSTDIYIIYQWSKSSENACQSVIKPLGRAIVCQKEFQKVGLVVKVVADEEVKSGSLIAKAVDCSLRSVLLKNGWRCIGNGCTVNSSFASSEEKNDLYAFHVTVQADTDDGFVFLVSPDVVRFSRLKIMDLLGSKMKQRFHGGEGVIMDEYCFTTSCSVLPSLCEGHVIGLSRLHPAGEDFEHMGELWSFKHGLVLPNDYFVHIQFTDEGCANKHWFPSSFVLQGSGLTPAPQTIRAANAVFALESFMRIIEAWDFFDGGLLRIKVTFIAWLFGNAKLLYFQPPKLVQPIRIPLTLILIVASIRVGKPLVPDMTAYHKMGACRLGISSDLPVWAKATCNINNHILNVNDSTFLPTTVDGKISFLRGLLSNHDFRTPKPSLELLSHSETSEHIQIQGSTASPSKGIQSGTHLCVQDVLSINMTPKFRPLFKGRKAVKKTIQSGNGIPSSLKSGGIENEPCLLTVTGSIRMDLHKDEPIPRPVLKGNAAIEKDGALRPFRRNLNPKEDAAVPKDGVNFHISSQTSINKEKTRVFLDKGTNKGLSNSRKVMPVEKAGEVPSDNQDKEDIENLPKKQGNQLSEIEARKENRKSMPKKQVKQPSDIAEIEKSILKKQAKQPSNITIREDVENPVPKKGAKQPSDISAREDGEENPQKKRTKHQIESSDIIAKVIDCYARGQLGSLMVPELKSFLGAKKAKVGGKKEDLIQRIMTMLA